MGKSSKDKRKKQIAAGVKNPAAPITMRTPRTKKTISSLLDAMQDGREYASLIDLRPSQSFNARDEVRRALASIESIRQRPSFLYAGNAIFQTKDSRPWIDLSDDLPFSEMVATVSDDIKEVDIILITPGGILQQVSKLVNATRPRFESVGFILPHMAMSAGTVFALSGDEI